MKIENKIILTVFLTLAGLYASFVSFNEINPWIGLFLAALSLGFGIKFIVKFIKNQK